MFSQLIKVILKASFSMFVNWDFYSYALVVVVIQVTCLPCMRYIFNCKGRHRIGVAIGDKILDMGVVKHLFNGQVMSTNQDCFEQVCS